MPPEGPAPLDSKLVRVFGHTTRIKVLEYLDIHRLASVPELAKALRIPENQIGYHVGVLLECDYIERSVTRRRNDKDAQFYELKRPTVYPTSSSLTSLLKGEPVTKDTLHAFACKVSSALEASAADESTNPTLAIERLALTAGHMTIAHEAVRLTVANLRGLHTQSRQLNIATGVPLLSVELGIAILPATPPDSKDRTSRE